jgi:hypothetical protein
MPSSNEKRQEIVARRTTIVCPKTVALAQMLQGNGLVFEEGKLKYTSGITSENRKSIITTVLNDKNAMFRICLTKLSNVICNVEISGDFGSWMTKNGTATIQIPIPTQQFYNIALEDPYRSFSMRTSNVGTMIRDHLKDLIEDFIDNGQSHCSCPNRDRLLLLLYALEITYLPIDGDGNILHTADPVILNRHTDLCELFKVRAMNRSITDLERVSQEEISFQPALVYNFQVDASAVRMPDNWQADQIMNADEISTIRFPSIETNNRPTSTGIPSGMPTITTEELMLRLLDAEVFLTSVLDPGNPLPPNVKQIALKADSLKRSIADGMYTAEGAKLIIEAAAELTSTEAYNNRFSDPCWEEEYVPYKGNDSHTEARRHNDLDLIHHDNDQVRHDRKRRALELTNAAMNPSTGTIEDQGDDDAIVWKEVETVTYPIVENDIQVGYLVVATDNSPIDEDDLPSPESHVDDHMQPTSELTNAVMTPSMAEVSALVTAPVVDNVLSLNTQAETPTITTDIVFDAQHGNSRSSNEPKSDFR